MTRTTLRSLALMTLLTGITASGCGRGGPTQTQIPAPQTVEADPTPVSIADYLGLNETQRVSLQTLQTQYEQGKESLYADPSVDPMALMPTITQAYEAVVLRILTPGQQSRYEELKARVSEPYRAHLLETGSSLDHLIVEGNPPHVHTSRPAADHEDPTRDENILD